MLRLTPLILTLTSLFSLSYAEGWACTSGVKACGRYQNTVHCVGGMCRACADGEFVTSFIIVSVVGVKKEMLSEDC